MTAANPSLEARVINLETRVDGHDKAIADLQSAQREDSESRGMLLALCSSVDAVANGHRELARESHARDERLAQDLETLKRGPVQAASPALALLANFIAQGITGQDAASVEALSTSLVVLLSALFGPQLKERFGGLLARWFPPKPAPTTQATEAPKPQAAAVVDEEDDEPTRPGGSTDKEIH